VRAIDRDPRREWPSAGDERRRRHQQHATQGAHTRERDPVDAASGGDDEPAAVDEAWWPTPSLGSTARSRCPLPLVSSAPFYAVGHRPPTVASRMVPSARRSTQPRLTLGIVARGAPCTNLFDVFLGHLFGYVWPRADGRGAGQKRRRNPFDVRPGSGIHRGARAAGAAYFSSNSAARNIALPACCA
jgi:hypothetical protein